MIKYAKKEDRKQIALLYEGIDRIHCDNVPDTFKLVLAENRQELILDDMNNDNIRYIVAEVNGEILGFAKLLIKQIPDNHPVLLPKKLLHIEEIAVKEKRVGIGTQLITYAESVAKELEASLLTLNVIKFNEDAKKFYLKTGFESAFEGMVKALNWKTFISRLRIN